MKLRNPFRRRRTPHQDEGRPTTAQYLAELAHRDFVYPADHLLPQGSVNRGDELVWVATRVEMYAEAGSLDEGTPHVLDAEINHRHAQWDDAVDLVAAHRTRTAKALHAEEAEHLTGLLEALGALRAEKARAHTENDHWREILHGAPVTPPPTTPHERLAEPESNGLVLAVPAAATTVAPWLGPGTEPVAAPGTERSAHILKEEHA